MSKILEKLPFLGSTRFWALVIIGVATALQDAGAIGEGLMQSIMFVCGGHIGVRTVDRMGENLGKVQ